MKWLTRLGLSALTFVLGGLVVGLGGQAQAQQIPAPDLYDGATDCTTNVPSVIRAARPGAMSTLDNALTGFGPIDTTAGDNTRLVAVVGTPVACDDNAVGSEFDTAKRLYDDAAAAKALASGEDPDPLAVADYATKKAARDDFGGDIYEALYTQYDRQASARKAITDYNAVVADTTGSFTVAKTQYDALNITATGNTNLVAYVPDDPATADTDEEVLGTYGGRGTVAGFRDLGGSGLFAAVGDADTSTAVTTDGEFAPAFLTALESAFTTGGTLRLATDTSGATPVAAVSTDTTTLGEISNYLTHWNRIVDTAAKHVADGTSNEVSNLAELQETLRRVTAARDHVQREQRRLVNVLRAVNYNYDHDNDGGTTPEVSVSSVLRTFDNELAKRTSAANTVRSAVTALENARNAVQTGMRNPGTFLGQVVDLRQYQKDQADAQVEEFGDDVPDSVSKAAEDAAKALMNAQADLQAHVDLVGDDDNPASALLNALLEDPTLPNGMANPADDDGQALIDAISTNYSTAKDAMDAAQAAKAATDGLTGDDGKIADIEAKLAAKAEYIGNLGAEIGIDAATGDGMIELADGTMGSRIDKNEEDIGMLDGRVTQNETDIASNTAAIGVNAGNITANAANILANAGNIADNAGNIMTNMTAIGENYAHIEENHGMIMTNAAAIADNHANIAANNGMIMQNSGMISDNRAMIMENREMMDTLKAGIASAVAMAGMPEIGDRGVSVGAGTYDGESAIAVGVHFSGENSRFKVGISSADGETSASVGAGWSF